MPFLEDFEIIKAMDPKDKSYLAGQLLLAMPGIGDPRFAKAVIFLCTHDESGAMGLMINHPVPGADVGKLLGQFDITARDETPPGLFQRPVLGGGPVDTERGFLLHSKDFVTNDTIHINRFFSVSSTIASLKAAAAGRGPRDILFILGYAKWTEGQLEKELQDNAWLTTQATEELVFRTEPEMAWNRAMAQIGIDPSMLSTEAGRA